MNILVTGSNGFIGRNIVKELVKKDCVIGCGRKEASQIETGGYVRWDIAGETCPDELYDREFDIIVHAAASLDKDDRKEELITTNCLGAHRIYTLAVRKHVKKVIYLSSLPVVGVPFPTPITESSEIKPMTMYHAAKAAGEFILAQVEKQGIDIMNLRIPSTIGPGMPSGTIVPVFLKQALLGKALTLPGRGTRRQNYIDVRDIAFAVRRIIGGEIPCGTYNLASDETVSNYEMACMCIEAANSESEIRFSPQPDPCDGWAWDTDTSKLKNAIGSFTNHTIRESLKDIADDIKKRIEL